MKEFELRPCRDGCGKMMVVWPESTLTERACFDCGGNGTEKCCQSCTFYYGGDWEQNYIDQCCELGGSHPPMTHLKGWPFKNGCKHWQVSMWFIPMSDEEIEAMDAGRTKAEKVD